MLHYVVFTYFPILETSNVPRIGRKPFYFTPQIIPCSIYNCFIINFIIVALVPVIGGVSTAVVVAVVILAVLVITVIILVQRHKLE